MAKRDDLTLDEALSDPLILALVRADGADPHSLRRSWQPLAERLAARAGKGAGEGGDAGPTQSRPGEGRAGDGRDADPWAGRRALRAVIEDCLCAARARAAAGHDSRGLI